MTSPEGKSHSGVDVDPDDVHFSKLPGNTMEDKLQSAIKENSVVVFGRSTCPFCIEVTRTLAELQVPFIYYRVDQMGTTGPAVHEALKTVTSQRTVPYVYINGQLLGGCDATKAAIASGDFDRRLGAANGADLEVGEPVKPQARLVGVDEGAPHLIGALFEFPNTVDGRVIRTVALQVFIVSVLLAIFAYKKDDRWAWLSVGLLVDFCLRFYAGAGISPFGAVAMWATAVWDFAGPRFFGRATGPVWGAGPPKQFAVFVGVCFSAVIVVLQFTHAWPAALAVAAVLAFFAGLECFLNFCAGCWFFGHFIRLKLVSDTVYKVHVDTLPETKYTWEDWTKQINPPKPQRESHSFENHSARTRIDLNYKTGKNADVEREDFDFIRHSKIGFFSGVVGVAAIPALFKFSSLILGTPALVWQILTLLSLIWTVFFTVPYVAKAIYYPHKVRAEWQHPSMNNAFSLPSFLIMIYAFLAWDTYSTPLARVLWWAGASTSTLLAVIVVGNWLSTARHEGHVTGAMAMPPVGLFVAAIVGPIVDPAYTDVSFLFFGFAIIMWITLFVMHFQRTIVGHNADPRQRMFASIWFAAPAAGSIAWAVLNAPPGGPYLMDSVSQTLFYIAISLALVCVWMSWRRFLWADRFFMQMWAWGFPTAALAWAALLYDATINTALSKVLAVCLMSLACIIAWVLVFRTMGGVARVKVFIPEHKWGPLSHLPLAQDAMRALLQRTVETANSLADAPRNTRLSTSMRDSWRSFVTINSHYSELKRAICFPQIGAFFPGHQKRAIAMDEELLAEQAALDAMINAAPGAADVVALRDAVQQFAHRADATFTYVEDHVRPVTRRYIPGPVQVKIMNDCWDLGETLQGGAAGWFPVIPAVVSALPMQSQRLTYLRAFLWAMPWRCQQLGIMVALGVDPVLWYRIKHAMPDIIPRGEAGWKRY